MPSVVELDLPSKLDLINTESKLEKGAVIYSVENSSLSTVNAGFPRIEGRSLINWIDLFARGDKVRILELGGGVHQKAAIEILEKYRDSSNIELVGLEPRPLTDQTKIKLSEFENYHRIEKGISALSGLELEREKFDIIFAHHVMEHLPNPLWAIQQASGLLNPGGLLFCDRALFYTDTVQKFANLLKQQGVSIVYSYDPEKIESELRKRGLVKTDIALRIHNNHPDFQIIEGRQLVDFSNPGWTARDFDVFTY